jgi:hypothetical protein
LKLELAKVVTGLIKELDARFPEQTIFNAMGIIYPQYWLQAYVNMFFPKHLEVLKKIYGNPRACENS